MTIRLFQLPAEKAGAIICALTSLVLTALGLLALLLAGRYIISHLTAIF